LEKQTLDGTGASFTSFLKIIAESFLPKEKSKLKMKNEVIFRVLRFPFPFLILAKI
jgi:hypothetical protein